MVPLWDKLRSESKECWKPHYNRNYWATLRRIVVCRVGLCIGAMKHGGRVLECDRGRRKKKREEVEEEEEENAGTRRRPPRSLSWLQHLANWRLPSSQLVLCKWDLCTRREERECVSSTPVYLTMLLRYWTYINNRRSEKRSTKPYNYAEKSRNKITLH